MGVIAYGGHEGVVVVRVEVLVLVPGVVGVGGGRGRGHRGGRRLFGVVVAAVLGAVEGRRRGVAGSGGRLRIGGWRREWGQGRLCSASAAVAPFPLAFPRRQRFIVRHGRQGRHRLRRYLFLPFLRHCSLVRVRAGGILRVLQEGWSLRRRVRGWRPRRRVSLQPRV